MKSIRFTSNYFAKLAVCAVLALGAASLAHADDVKPVDPTGTWIWTTPGRNGGPDRTNTLTLKYDSGKLTGSLSTPGRARRNADGDNSAAPATPPPPVKTDISEGTVTGDEIAFKVTRSFGGNDVTIPYKGKIDGDKITGTVTMAGRNGGDPTDRPWSATKQK